MGEGMSQVGLDPVLIVVGQRTDRRGISGFVLVGRRAAGRQKSQEAQEASRADHRSLPDDLLFWGGGLSIRLVACSPMIASEPDANLKAGQPQRGIRMIKSGVDHIASLRDNRAVYLHGKHIDEVTSDTASPNSVKSIARPFEERQPAKGRVSRRRCRRS